MNTDWNWFFSSFCQSAAALIGIIAAFLISRLIGLNEKVHAIISGFEELVIDRNKILHSLGQRRFRWYNSTLMQVSTHLRDEIRAGEFDDLSDIDILEKIYSEDDRLYKANDVVLKTFHELYERYRHPQATELPLTHALSENIRKERELIEQLEVETRKLILLFKKNEQELRVFSDTFKPVSLIIIVLMIAFPVTVIYPLHFLPVTGNKMPDADWYPLPVLSSLFSLKNFLLLFFFITIEGIFLHFLNMNYKMSREITAALGKHSRDFQQIEWYSPYLGS
ncbi:hypothetical protein [Chitinophaga vietnamensis]|uniref:hypothetical protein n=1 Tax=Chitinophaga vietnamensis TaxID=2593957 RepID=UPI0011776C97|nr:hypothetical protein [Chitinophaga vietnamensis]